MRPIGESLKTILGIQGGVSKMRLFCKVITGRIKVLRLWYVFGSGEGPRQRPDAMASQSRII